jgi:hypothetical protein
MHYTSRPPVVKTDFYFTGSSGMRSAWRARFPLPVVVRPNHQAAYAPPAPAAGCRPSRVRPRGPTLSDGRPYRLWRLEVSSICMPVGEPRPPIPGATRCSAGITPTRCRAAPPDALAGAFSLCPSGRRACGVDRNTRIPPRLRAQFSHAARTRELGGGLHARIQGVVVQRRYGEGTGVGPDAGAA